MSKLSERLSKKIEKELGILCRPETFRRTYAGRNQKACGGFLWEMEVDGSVCRIGSTDPASYLVRKDVYLEAEGDEIFGEKIKKD